MPCIDQCICLRFQQNTVVFRCSIVPPTNRLRDIEKLLCISNFRIGRPNQIIVINDWIIRWFRIPGNRFTLPVTCYGMRIDLQVSACITETPFPKDQRHLCIDNNIAWIQGWKIKIEKRPTFTIVEIGRADKPFIPIAAVFIWNTGSYHGRPYGLPCRCRDRRIN